MQEISRYFKKLHNGFERGRCRALRKYEVTGTQMDLLEYLYYGKEKNNTLSEIAAFFGVQHTSVIHVIKVLESKQMIYREEQNGKRKPIFLTKLGREVMEDIDRHKMQKDEMLYQGFTEEELQTLEQMLGRIHHNMEQTAALEAEDE